MGGCSTEGGKGIPLHRWPTDPGVAKKWESCVKLTRKDFPQNDTTKFSEICGLHFHLDQYENYQTWINGGTKNLYLIHGATPHPSKEFAKQAHGNFTRRKRGECC